MGTTEVTQGLYRKVMGMNPSYNKKCGDNCPVEKVSWYDAVAFANKLSEMEGLEKCYSGKWRRISLIQTVQAMPYQQRQNGSMQLEEERPSSIQEVTILERLLGMLETVEIRRIP